MVITRLLSFGDLEAYLQYIAHLLGAAITAPNSQISCRLLISGDHICACSSAQQKFDELGVIEFCGNMQRCEALLACGVYITAQCE